MILYRKKHQTSPQYTRLHELEKKVQKHSYELLMKNTFYAFIIVWFIILINSLTSKTLGQVQVHKQIFLAKGWIVLRNVLLSDYVLVAPAFIVREILLNTYLCTKHVKFPVKTSKCKINKYVVCCMLNCKNKLVWSQLTIFSLGKWLCWYLNISRMIEVWEWFNQKIYYLLKHTYFLIYFECGPACFPIL